MKYRYRCKAWRCLPSHGDYQHCGGRHARLCSRQVFHGLKLFPIEVSQNLGCIAEIISLLKVDISL